MRSVRVDNDSVPAGNNEPVIKAWPYLKKQVKIILDSSTCSFSSSFHLPLHYLTKTSSLSTRPVKLDTVNDLGRPTINNKNRITNSQSQCNGLAICQGTHLVLSACIIVPACIDSPVPMLASEVAIQCTSVVFLSPLDNISVKLLAAVFNENYKSKN